ncbi:hypothetical protein QBC44DRAFT_316142, partial [Cladorrhinum sp. PSN332]
MFLQAKLGLLFFARFWALILIRFLTFCQTLCDSATGWILVRLRYVPVIRLRWEFLPDAARQSPRSHFLPPWSSSESTRSSIHPSPENHDAGADAVAFFSGYLMHNLAKGAAVRNDMWIMGTGFSSSFSVFQVQSRDAGMLNLIAVEAFSVPSCCVMSQDHIVMDSAVTCGLM